MSVCNYQVSILGCTGESVDSVVSDMIQKLLEDGDTAVILPQHSISLESQCVKNVAIRFGEDGNRKNLPDLFSSNWCCGVSLVKLEADKVDKVLTNPETRKRFLEKLRDIIPSDMHNTDEQVGPLLDCDDAGFDTEGWKAGFDSSSCCVGIYSSIQRRPCDNDTFGFNREHPSYYLLCKAGSGLAGQMFHSRLTTALKGGESLQSALSETGTPGRNALRRVISAGKRNRARILAVAAETLGFHTLDSIGDVACHATNHARMLICDVVSITHPLRCTPTAMHSYCYAPLFAGHCIQQS